jgi:hypothetical protein
VEVERVAMKLPNGAAHPDIGGKAEFFEGLGFQRDRWETLAAACRNLGFREQRNIFQR